MTTVLPCWPVHQSRMMECSGRDLSQYAILWRRHDTTNHQGVLAPACLLLVVSHCERQRGTTDPAEMATQQPTVQKSAHTSDVTEPSKITWAEKKSETPLAFPTINHTPVPFPLGLLVCPVDFPTESTIHLSLPLGSDFVFCV